MNKKFLTGALCALLVGGLLTTGTFAYFTDKDAATNEFTVGNVKIDLFENFCAEDAQNMVPGRDVKKEVFVTNTGVNDAYTRVHVAIPTAIDDGDPSYNASNNFLHWNFVADNYKDGKWSVLPYNTENDYGYKGNGLDEDGTARWNFYTTTVNEVEYNVYVLTYRQELEAGQTTPSAISKVYLDTSVDTVKEEGQIVGYKDNKGNEIDLAENSFNILVVAESTQAEGFDNAYDALNTAFGDPQKGYKADFTTVAKGTGNVHQHGNN